MSKIQKALSKLRAANSGSVRAGREKVANDSDSLIVAKLAMRHKGGTDDSDSLSHNAGRVLEIDRDALRRAGLLAPECHEQLLANQYREIKRPLIAHAFGKKATQIQGGNLIIVTSALAGEGKTFTSINLALSMAREQDHSVILVDADVVKPHLSDIFGASDLSGLLDVLEDASLAVDDVVLPTDVKGLSILPAGRPRHHATELLASSRMDNLMSSVRNAEPGSLVVMDSPPLLQTSESKVLASVAGQVVLVVRAEETEQGAVLNAIDLLGEDKAVNLVLNQVRNASSEYQYGYGYRYGIRKESKGSVTLPDKGLWEQ